MPDLDQLRVALAGRFTIERDVGTGGMATVFLARDVRHDRRVAIKVLRAEVAGALGEERFAREIRIVARLSHPHILPLFDSGNVGGRLFYVMPFVDGESLRDRIAREGQLAPADAVHVAREVADALDYAHRLGIVHRDIKPGNILLGAYLPPMRAAVSGHALVADFGIAQALSDSGTDHLTSLGLAVGTPAYMSPEQISADSTDGRSDIYSLGCVLYEMLTGEPPFTGGSVRTVLARHLTDTPIAPHLLRPDIPEHVERALTIALAKAPADRFATAADFALALEAPTAHANARETSVRAATTAVVREGGSGRTRERAASLGPMVSKLCDRWQQINAFDAFFRAHRRTSPGTPQIFILPGHEAEAHESLIERIRRTSLAHLAADIGAADRATVASFKVPWPRSEDLELCTRDLAIALFRECHPSYMGSDLSADALARIPSFALTPIVVIEHDIRIRGRRDDPDPRLIEWYARDFWAGMRASRDLPQFLVFLKIIFPADSSSASRWMSWLRPRGARADELSRSLMAIVKQPDPPCPTLMFAELAPVSADDVKEWLDRHGIYDSDQRRHELAAELFKRTPTMHMAQVEVVLERIHRAFVTDHTQGRGYAT